VAGVGEKRASTDADHTFNDLVVDHGPEPVRKNSSREQCSIDVIGLRHRADRHRVPGLELTLHDAARGVAVARDGPVYELPGERGVPGLVADDLSEGVANDGGLGVFERLRRRRMTACAVAG
jgi:hypothetical protein